MKSAVELNDDCEAERPPSRAVIVFLVGLFLTPVWSFAGLCITPAGVRVPADWFSLLGGIVMLLSLAACAFAPMWMCQHIGKKITMGVLGVMAWFVSFGFASILYCEKFGYVD